MRHQLTDLCRIILFPVFFLLVQQGFLAAQTCNNWLNLPSYQSYVSVGDLDVTGTKITVEATFMRTAPYTGGQIWAGDLVSKHVHPTDANYLLRPNNAEITTSNGYFRTPDICEIELNKIYHAAMVYDGSTLKFYRNGYLMSSVPATGTMYQNNYETRIGLYDALVHNTNLIGYINEVRIWNVVRTQAQIRAYMNTSLPSPATQSGLLAYYTFNSLINKQGNTAWNGTIGGSATINRTIPDCSFVADSCAAKPGELEGSFDFVYKQDVCSPFKVQFNGTGINPSTTFWDFGDGSTKTADLNPSHTYDSEGNYLVRYGISAGVSTDTIEKLVTIRVFEEDVIVTPDTTICSGTTKQLRTKPSLSFCWFPTTYLDNPNSPNPTTSTPHDITYYFTAETTGNNLIANGNFSQGNTGFTSGYNYASNNLTEGQYYVHTNPSAWNPSLSKCGDHTTGNGNMMLVNGSPVPDVNVWRQTINVKPNTNYAFSTWIQALYPPNPAILQFSINGQTTGVVITASLPTCTWDQFYTTWNSGNNTTAVISIVNKNTQIQGNDFALDDISFAEVFVKRDSVKIFVDKPVVTATVDTSICSGKSVQLQASGAQTYQWSPSQGLSNTSSASPIATPSVSTRYIVTGTSSKGCIAKDTVMVNLFPKASILVSDDTTICKNTNVSLAASGGIGYTWTPSSSLSNPAVANPVASPLVNTKYYVTIKDNYACEYSDSVSVSIRPDPDFQVNADVSICPKDSAQLWASGGDEYVWQPAVGISGLIGPNLKACPNVTTEYTVRITENTCHETAELKTRVTVLPLPDLLVQKSSDIDCRNTQSILNVSGALNYQWFPAQGLDNPGLPNPVAQPGITTRYYVNGTSNDGCSNVDSIDVFVYPKPDIRVTADTMICKNASAQIYASGGNSYSWSPAASLDDPSSANPIASPDTSTKYFVKIVDAIACEYLDSVQVMIRPEPIFDAIAGVTGCKGDTLQLSASGGDQYEWTPPLGLSNAALANPLALPGESRDYSVTITESVCNQSVTLNTSIVVLPSPIITAVSTNDIDCSQAQTQLTASGASEYNWFPGDRINNPDVFNPIASPTITTEYIVKGTDLNGCTGFDTVVVKVENINKSEYLMPNAFTPNNDGLNDCYKIKYWGSVDDFEFSVFNRWGNRLFYTKDPGQCWDGTFKGIPQDPGVYIYMIKGKTFCEPEVFRKGTFLLIR